MHSAQPLDILFEEAGASLGRIERELRLKDEARDARVEARLAAIELQAFKAEEDRQRIFAARLAELQNGKDGEPGRDGKDADLSKLNEDFTDIVHAWEMRISEKLAEVKNGKDGEPGRDADIEPLIVKFNELETRFEESFDRYQLQIDGEISQKLAKVRDGKDGEPGKEGQPGKDGQDGKLPIAREWTDTVHYEGEVVRHNGETYQALKNTGREPPHSDWGVMARRGTDGRGFILRGTYDASAEYKQHDIVMINRNSFAAKYDSPGECPGDGWQLFACSGYKGKEGPPGQTGPTGADGRSVSIVKWEADPDEMALRVADSTGNSFIVDLRPIADRILEEAR